MASRNPSQKHFTCDDDQEIFYRHWPATAHPENKSHPKRAVILFHRGHEHSGRWQSFVDECGLNDCDVFAWDARGHGKTEGERGAAESFARLVRDADNFYHHIVENYQIDPSQFAVVGQSVGAVVAATWIHDYCPPIRSMVLATPAFRIKLYVPFAITGLRLLHKVRPKTFIKSYVRPEMLTHDPEQAQSYANDTLVSPQIATNILLDLHDTSTRLIDDAHAIRTPTLMFVSGKDYVVRQDVQHDFFEGLSSEDKQISVLPDFHHSTFAELGRVEIIRQSGEFIRKRWNHDETKPSSNTISAPSRHRYERLKSSPSLGGRMNYFAQRFALNTAGRLSRGVRIGWRDGFDSGQSLDHVYRNRAEGSLLLGKLIDRGYLNSIGWMGIRQRKIHMESLLDDMIERKLADGKTSLTIMDLAAGPGRYVLETLARHPDKDLKAILCDRDPYGIAEGKALASKLGLSDQVTFVQSDAFDRNAIANASDDLPIDIAIVSGLYELFPPNEPLRESLKGIADVLADDGEMLYTNQPWHPQQEMIARVLPNRDGEPWVMRCRSQAEMDTLVGEVGLRRTDLLIDRWGIFSVASAKRDLALSL